MVLKFGVIHFPPAACVQGACPQRGYYIDAMDAVCRAWRLDCTFDNFNSTEYGDVDETGVATGLLGAIQRGEYDATLPFMSPTYRRLRGVAFSDVYRMGDLALITRSPNVSHESINWNVLYTFGWEVWICFLFAIFTMVLWTSILVVLSRRFLLVSLSVHSMGRFSVSSRASHLQSIFDLATSELIDAKGRSSSTRIVSCVWFFFALILGSAYSGALFQMSFAASNYLPFEDLDTFARCLETRRCRLLTDSMSISSLQRVMATETEIGRRITKALEDNPPVAEPSLEMFSKRILEETDQFLVAIPSTEFVISITGGNRNREFYVMELGIGEQCAFATQKGSPILPLLNRISSIFRESDLHTAVVLMGHYVGSSTHDHGGKHIHGGREIDRGMASLISILTLYGTALLCCVIILLVECVISRKFKTYECSS